MSPVPSPRLQKDQRPPASGRRPLRDNPRLILAGMLLLLAALVGTVALANRSTGLSPDFLTEFVLYALWAADLTILLGLTFVLARNVVKLIVERRRALPFARFRAKLVAVLLGMTLIPAVLVLIVGSELIRNSVDRWFNAPIEEVLTSANTIAGDYYQDRQARVADHAARIARALARMSFNGADVTGVRDLISPEVAQERVQMVEVYRVNEIVSPPQVLPYVDVAAPTLPPGYRREIADRLAARTAAGNAEPPRLEPRSTGGDEPTKSASRTDSLVTLHRPTPETRIFAPGFSLPSRSVTRRAGAAWIAAKKPAAPRGPRAERRRRRRRRSAPGRSTPRGCVRPMPRCRRGPRRSSRPWRTTLTASAWRKT
jgi:two-component system nitrogen regulation sensor histidine kinase NtrY